MAENRTDAGRDAFCVGKDILNGWEGKNVRLPGLYGPEDQKTREVLSFPLPMMYNKIIDRRRDLALLKRFFCILLILMLPCAALAEYTMAGYDDSSTYRTWSSNQFFSRMEEKTGIRFRYVQYTKQEDWRKAKAAMQADSPDLPDVLFKAELSGPECLELLEKGVLIDLAPYLESCCPNLWALLQSHSEYMQAITLPGGAIAALPAFTDQPAQNSVWLNQVWMDALGLSMPETAEELTEVLRAFRDGDPNKNGRKDEIPLAFLGSFDLKFLAHAFGLIANDYNIRAVDGQAVFMPLDSRYREFVEWLHMLYAEKLLDPQGFTTSDPLRTVEKDTATKVYGGVITTLPTNFMPTAWAADYAVMPPLTWEGESIYRDFAGPVTRGTFAVTCACDNVQEILGWVDLFYTEEVYVLSSVGQENVDYVIDGDGTWRMTEASRNNSYFTSEVLIASGTSYPANATYDFQSRYYDPMVSRITDQLQVVQGKAVQPFPYYTLTAEQEAQIAPLQSRIGRLVDESLARWVIGETEISDQSFTDFEAQLEEAGIREFLAFWNDILEGL